MVTTTIKEKSIKLPMDILQSLNWNDNDEITITEEYGRLIIEKSGHIPNAETLKAIEEVEEMKKNPHLYKSYNSFSEILDEINEELENEKI